MSFAGHVRDIVKVVYETFDNLPKAGKPKPNEWTVLSAFVLCETRIETFESTSSSHDSLSISEPTYHVVCLATGTKVVGQSQLSLSGDRLHDSHAEILARRAFHRFILIELAKLYKNESSAYFQIDPKSKKCTLNPSFKVVFVTTHCPCGDASIFPKSDSVLVCDTVQNDLKRKPSPLSIPHDVKRIKLGQPSQPCDMNRTGAKCVDGGAQDMLESGVNYHVTGVLRTKPGRGDKSYSLSCSDKISKWNILGIQGCLPMLLLTKPIYIDVIIVTGKTFDDQAIRRGLIGRMNDMCGPVKSTYKLNQPDILHSALNFTHSRTQCDMKPCPSSVISYMKGRSFHTEVAVDGYRQGITKKAIGTSKSRLSICRYELFKLFIDIISSDAITASARIFSLCEIGAQNSYISWKKSSSYTEAWKQIRDQIDVFKLWPTKDERFSQFLPSLSDSPAASVAAIASAAVQ